jgi:molybdopterin synthase catalytic subunit
MPDTVVLTEDALDVAAVSAAVGADEAGAISLFVGTTRCSFEGRRVVTLEYEAYAPMAEREMEKLCAAARHTWPDIVAVAVHHRLGLVPVGQASVVVAVSSPHRKDAIGASRPSPPPAVDLRSRDVR